MLYRRHVHSVSKSGSSLITGDVTFSEGSNVTLTQVGNNIEIAATGGGGGGGAPTTAQYVTLATDATLTNERVLTGTANQVIITDNGAGSTVVLSLPQSIHTGASPTFTGLTLSGLGNTGVLYSDSGVVSVDTTNFTWDKTNKSLITGDPGSEGTGINLNGSTYNSRLKVSDIGGTTPAQLIIHRHSSTLPAAIVAFTSKSDTSSHTAVAAGDELFFVSASGWTGTHYDTFGIISFLADSAGTVSSTSSPGRINFWVPPDSSDSPAIALSIRHNKVIEMSGYGTGIAHFSSSGVISSSNIVNADVDAAAAIAFSKLAALTSGNVLYGVTNVATSTALNTIAVTALTGTANQINVSASVGSVTLSTPQSIGTSSSPTFSGLTLSGLGLGVVHSSSGGVLSSSLIVNADVSGSAAIAYSKLNLATSIVNADVSTSAAIAYSKLNLATSIVNADISASAAIAYSKLNLASSIVNADISASAAIAFSKLASLSSANILVGNGSNVATAVAVTGDISLTNAGVTAYSGTVPVNKGGTNITSYTTGDLIYASGAGTLAKRAIGSSGDILTVSGGLPVWAPPAGASISIGSSITSGTATRVLFEGAGPVLADDASFTYDSTNNILYVPEIAGGSTGSDSLMVSANTATFNDTNTGRIQFMERAVWDTTFTVTGSAGVLSSGLISHTGTITSSLGINIFPSFQANFTFRYSTNQTVSSFPTFLAAPIFQPTAAVTDLAAFTQFAGFISRPQFAPDISSGTATTDLLIGYSAAPVTRRINAGTSVVTNIICFGTYTTPLILANDLENVTATNLYHFKAANPFNGSVTLTNNIGVYIPALSLGTNRYGYYSDIAANANYWSIYSNGDAQSAHKGLFKIGDMVAPTALMHTTGSTTARASMRIESGTAPTSPNSGDLWHDSTRQCFQVYCGGATLGIQKVLFVATAAATIGGTGAETTLAGTGIGSLTLPANFLTVGKTLKLRAWGVYGTKAPAVGTFDIRFKYGSTTLITLSPTLTGSLTNQMWEAEFELTCRTTGATGTVFPQGEVELFTSTTASGLIVAGPTGTTTINTTASSKIDITADWGTSNASNTITCNNFTVEVLY